jgi:arginine exporter protein ArgO
MDWKTRFFDAHGERLVFMAAAAVFGIGLIALGKWLLDSAELTGSGVALLIGVGTLALNKARSKSEEINSEAENGKK